MIYESPVCTPEGRDKVLHYHRQYLPWLAKLPQEAKVPDIPTEARLDTGDYNSCLLSRGPLLKMGASALLSGHHGLHANLYRPWTKGMCRPSHALSRQIRRVVCRKPSRTQPHTSACLQSSKTLSGVAVQDDLLGQQHAA